MCVRDALFYNAEHAKTCRSARLPVFISTLFCIVMRVSRIIGYVRAICTVNYGLPSVDLASALMK
jgi:hypothetical protein